LLGLSNTAAKEAFEPILARTRSERADTRGVAARALRPYPVASTEPHLLRLVADEGSAVQAAALRSLASVHPSDQGCTRILNLVQAEKVRPINLIIAHSAVSSCESAVIDDFFEAIRSKKNLEANLRERVRRWERDRRD